MPRRRMIDPTIWEDENFGILSDKAKLLFIACISNADDDGRLSANPSNLRAMAFRFEEISIKKVEDITIELGEKVKNFKLYTVNSHSYIQLLKWESYQTQREDRRKPSKYPNVTECQPDDGQLSDISQLKLSKDKLSKDKLREDNVLCLEIISDLNSVLNTSYKRQTPKTIELIEARLKDGFTLDNFKTVHRKMAQAWGTDNKMRQYLRPQTLYSTKFESYLNRPADLKVSVAGAKTHQAAQEWLKEKGETDVGQKAIQ